MREIFQILLMVPGVLFMLLRIYFSFRRHRWTYMRRFSATVKRSVEDQKSASAIISHQKSLLSIPFRELISSMF